MTNNRYQPNRVVAQIFTYCYEAFDYATTTVTSCHSDQPAWYNMYWNLEGLLIKAVPISKKFWLSLLTSTKMV